MENKSLLSLCSRKIGDAEVEIFAEGLKENIKVTDLYLTCNNIGPVGAKSLFGIFPFNITLTLIHLYNNKIGDEGAKAVSEALKRNTSLRILCLSCNNIGDEGAIELALTLQFSNSSLEILDLDDNNISDKGSNAFVTSLYRNKTLKDVFLKDNKMIKNPIFTDRITYS